MSAATALRPARSARPAPQRARRPRLVVVSEPRHSFRYLLGAITLAGVGVFGVVGLHALAAEQAFQVRALERDVQEAATRYDELTAEIAGLESPARVRAVAMVQLGMVPATQPGFIVANTVGSGDKDFAGSRGTLPASADGDVADPVKHVLAAGR